eukprot:COSAG06_NODE_354_length_16880_cov_7.746545_9_plen_91_part_00
MALDGPDCLGSSPLEGGLVLLLSLQPGVDGQRWARTICSGQRVCVSNLGSCTNRTRLFAVICRNKYNRRFVNKVEGFGKKGPNSNAGQAN